MDYCRLKKCCTTSRGVEIILVGELRGVAPCAGDKTCDVCVGDRDVTDPRARLPTPGQLISELAGSDAAVRDGRLLERCEIADILSDSCRTLTRRYAATPCGDVLPVPAGECVRCGLTEPSGRADFTDFIGLLSCAKLHPTPTPPGPSPAVAIVYPVCLP